MAGGFYSLLNITGFEPSPDYYSLLLWSRLMGPTVLSASVTDVGSLSYLRAYAHCSQPSQPSGSVTVLVINLSNSSQATVDLSFSDLNLTSSDVKDLAREEYIFTSAAGPGE